MTEAAVRLWGRPVGTVRWQADRGCAVFTYAPGFIDSGLEIAPLMMPLASTSYQFSHASHETFRGLPGLVADSLPDKFGTVLTDDWLAAQGRPPSSFNPVERLCFTGSRAIGALEFVPTDGPLGDGSDPLDLGQLVHLASEILIRRGNPPRRPDNRLTEDGMPAILQIGTSAGGSRAKAVVAWDGRDGVVRTGQGPVGDGDGHWLIKFDGVRGNKDREDDAPSGYGRIEYAYHLMATRAGIAMAECRLLAENGRHHFMTRRFDRKGHGDKLHLQTLSAMAHVHFDRPGTYSYEQVLQVCRQLNLPQFDVEAQFRRMVFNIVARNQDDHAKNTSFMMDPAGTWSLSPAYDVTFAYNPTGAWTRLHQTTLAGKRDDFTIDDIVACAATADIGRDRAIEILAEVCAAVADWPSCADEAGILPVNRDSIASSHRLGLTP